MSSAVLGARRTGPAGSRFGSTRSTSSLKRFIELTELTGCTSTVTGAGGTPEGAASPGTTGRSRRLRRVLVLEGQPQLGPEYDLAAVLDVQVLLNHFGDTQVTQRLAGGVHRGDRGVLPGLGACADDVDDSVHAHGILLDSADAAICSLS